MLYRIKLMTKQKLKPKLRFKEFKEDWKIDLFKNLEI